MFDLLRLVSKLSTNRQKQAGFSLIESVFSMQFLGIAALGVAQAFSFNLRMNNLTERKSAASFAAQQVIEELRTKAINDLKITGSDDGIPIEVDNKLYLVELSYCDNNSLCSSSMRHIKAKVFYQGKVVHEIETVFSKLN
jgi:Tfp pilus assembly protein PilV